MHSILGFRLILQKSFQSFKQYIRLHWLAQMSIQAGLHAALNILIEGVCC